MFCMLLPRLITIKTYIVHQSSICCRGSPFWSFGCANMRTFTWYSNLINGHCVIVAINVQGQVCHLDSVARYQEGTEWMSPKSQYILPTLLENGQRVCTTPTMGIVTHRRPRVLKTTLLDASPGFWLGHQHCTDRLLPLNTSDRFYCEPCRVHLFSSVSCLIRLKRQW